MHCSSRKLDLFVASFYEAVTKSAEFGTSNYSFPYYQEYILCACLVYVIFTRFDAITNVCQSLVGVKKKSMLKITTKCSKIWCVQPSFPEISMLICIYWIGWDWQLHCHKTWASPAVNVPIHVHHQPTNTAACMYTHMYSISPIGWPGLDRVCSKRPTLPAWSSWCEKGMWKGVGCWLQT